MEVHYLLMRSQRVITNRRCNQNCTYCTYRRAGDHARSITTAALRARIEAELALGVQQILLTGGEPTMRHDLPELVAHARTRGAQSVVLETNGTRVDSVLASSLAEAGLTLARVNLPAWSSALDQVTRTPGGFQATRTGLRALCEARLPLEITIALVRSTAALALEVPAGLAAEVGNVVERVVVVVPVESPDDRELLTYGDAAAVLAALNVACRRHGMRLQIADDSGPPPCMCGDLSRQHHLYALSPGGSDRQGFRHPHECLACKLLDRCPGVAEPYLERHPQALIEAIVDDRVRRRVSLVDTVDRQIARELVQPSFANRGTELREDAIVRVNFHCNQACDFCFVSTHLPAASDQAVRGAIREAAAAGKRVVLSGGEPTLHPKLAQYVALAKEVSHGDWPVEVQTNAVVLDDERRVRQLVDAGLDEAFVSLHGGTAEVSDLVTRAPGTFERTVMGVDHLMEAGVCMVLNFVICSLNFDRLSSVVSLVASRWPHAAINLSFVAPSTDLVPRDPSLFPRYTDVLPHLEQPVLQAHALGIDVFGLGAMCGLPLCLLPPRLAPLIAKPAIPAGADHGEFVRTRECSVCDLSLSCWGVRRGYAEIHGTSELRAVRC